jgi:hypothetical protein
LLIQFLHAKDLRGVHKSTARTFYNNDDALSALTLIKVKDGKE